MNLYKVNLVGLDGCIGRGGLNVSGSYVIASNSDEAYQMILTRLDKEAIRDEFKALKSVELIAMSDADLHWEIPKLFVCEK